jgi:hypothetical protein
MFLTEYQPAATETATMEVKMFVHNSPDSAEKELNEWLLKQRIRVCHVTQSQCERQGRFVFVVSVFFERL